ncbi:hypothetical protein M9H77_21029 [Catharanthus roseus]|uniref:Uncharacterized protein n=1 Tax=Catharanthus roseus TaxID=4058 RepID=A0ACC0ALV2_CATRO|nr:hypothetical protein M9H77_21029 [Catharanthus roseus]
MEIYCPENFTVFMLFEKTEDELPELIKKGTIKVGDVNKILCEDLSTYCQQTSLCLWSAEYGDDKDIDGELFLKLSLFSFFMFLVEDINVTNSTRIYSIFLMKAKTNHNDLQQYLDDAVLFHYLLSQDSNPLSQMN